MKFFALLLISYSVITIPVFAACASLSCVEAHPSAPLITTPAELARYMYTLVGQSGVHVTEYLDAAETNFGEFTVQVPTPLNDPTITGLSMLTHRTSGQTKMIMFIIHNGPRIFSVQYTTRAPITLPALTVKPAEPTECTQPQDTLSCDFQPLCLSLQALPVDKEPPKMRGQFIAQVSHDKKYVVCKTLMSDLAAIKPFFTAHMKEIHRRRLPFSFSSHS